MSEVLILVAIVATAAIVLGHIYLQVHKLPATDNRHARGPASMHDPSPTADKVLVDRIQWLFLILFAIAISTLALGIYAAGHRVEINPGLPGLETKLDATRSRVEATESKVEATQSQVTQAQSAISRIEQMIATIQPPASVKAWMGFNVYGTILISLLVLGLILLLLGFFVDYARARPNRSGETTTKSSTWASLLKNAAMLKIAGSFCLISSVTVASFKFEKLIGIEMQESPIELHVGLQHLVSEIVVVPTKTKIVEEPPAPPPPKPPPPDDTRPPKAQVRTTDVDCGQTSDPDKFVLKTFTLGKEDEFDGMDRQVTQETVATRLNEILNDIAAGAKARDLQGLVFVGSADKRTLGKITREHYSNNSTLAKKRAEFVQKAMAVQLEARVKAPQPHWMLVLNPELPRIRLSIDEAKRFDALRAVQICVAWTRKNEQEASR